MKGLLGKLQKWWWLVVIITNIISGIAVNSFKAGRAVEGVEQKFEQQDKRLEQNEKQHSEMNGVTKDNYAKLDAKLDTTNTRLGRVEGKQDVIIDMLKQQQRRADYQGVTADAHFYAIEDKN